MGNNLARQFQDAPLGQGHLTSTQAARQTALVPDAVVLHTASPRTLWVHKQAKSHGHRIRFVHAETSNLLFVNSTTTATNSTNSMTTTTKDFKGQLLFVTKAPHKDLRVIYKVLEPPAAPEGTAPSEASSSNMEDEPDHANHNHSNKKQPDDDEDGWTPVAKIEIDHVAACLTAFLGVKRDTPPPPPKLPHPKKPSTRTSASSASVASTASTASSSSKNSHKKAKSSPPNHNPTTRMTYCMSMCTRRSKFPRSPTVSWWWI